MGLAENPRDTHASRRNIFLGVGLAAIKLGDFIIDVHPLMGGILETMAGVGVSTLGVLAIMGAGMQQLEVNREQMRPTSIMDEVEVNT